MTAPAEIARNNGKKGGRPPGSVSRPVLRDYLSPGFIEKFTKKLEKLAMAGDQTAMRLVGEHIFGKAAQSLDITSGGKPIGNIIDSLNG